MSTTNFAPTPGELALVQQIFAAADPQKLGIITGDVAVKVFGGAKLSPLVLGEIWSIADEENNGWLSRKGISIAVRLIGWAQKGEKVNKALINKPGPVPHIEGVSALNPQATGVSLSKSPPPPALAPLSAQDKAKFARIFANAGPTNGLLSGEKSRDVFVKSKLPVEKLSQIWNLADTQDRGALDAVDFTVGMYLIQASMSGSLSFIPSTLPPGLYEAAGGSAKPPASGFVNPHLTGGSASTFSTNPSSAFSSTARGGLVPQYTGGQRLQQDVTGSALGSTGVSPRPPQLTGSAFGNGSVLGGGAFGGAPHPASLPWDITAAEKANADRVFDGLDTQKRGHIEGDVAVPFMLESKLPGDDLALIWDLADINNDGRLTRDGFAVALHLIQGKLAGKPVPATLPLSLVPPSMRSATSFAAPQGPFDAHKQIDLLGDDSPPTSAIPAQQTVGPSLPPRPAPQLPPRDRDPFGAPAFESNTNYLDDEDSSASAPHIQDKSAEIGNHRNQLNSTNQSLEKVKAERASVERMLADQAAQLTALQTQLASAKAAYETETKVLSALRERYSVQAGEIQKTREELIRAESDLSAVRVEKAEIEGAFLRDKEESRDLHKRMIAAGQQVEMFKAEVEKLKKDAKQQKGLLAIAKKQLSSKEADRLKAEKEAEEAAGEAALATKEREEAEAELARLEHQALTVSPVPALAKNVNTPERAPSRADSLMFAAGQALPTSAGTSPTPSILSPQVTGKSNNPFERLAMGNSTPRSGSPLTPFGHTSSPAGATGDALPRQVTAAEDAFGFERAFESNVEQGTVGTENSDLWDSATERTGVSTPKPLRAEMTGASTNESDVYSTPPSSAIGLAHTTGPSPAQPKNRPTLDEVNSKFPDLELERPFDSQATPSQEKHEAELIVGGNDLGAQLKDLDVEESDSDESDNDEDEIPLAKLAHEREKSMEKAESQGMTGEGSANGGAKPSFDDIFGGPTPATQGENTADASPFGLPSTQDSLGVENVFASPSVPGTAATAGNFEAKPAPAIGGVNAFDEAMGKLPPSPQSTVPQFSFDPAFDDDFDFTKASETKTFPPPPAPSVAQSPLQTNGTENGSGNGFASQAQSNGQVRPSFDDIFAVKPASKTASVTAFTPPPAQAAPAPAPAPAPVPQTTSSQPILGKSGFSFDDAFSEPQGISLDTSFASLDTSQSAKSSGGSRITNSSPPNSPGGLPQTQTNRISSVASSISSPSVRAKSPPLRTGKEGKNGKDGGQKEPHTTRSKLTIRNPFGKKKNKEPQPDRTSQFLTPPIEEEAGRLAASGADDDVEPVKTLCGMGFSRAQVVEALEKNGYDTTKALNGLLGQAS